MIITTSKELAVLSGGFYASNNFELVKTDVELETEAIINLISKPVYDKAKASYIEPTESNPIPDQPELVKHIQLPIAIMSSFRYMQGNMVTHSDNGRKVKINSQSERMAWGWMIEADDRAQLRKAQVATDRLINYLEESGLEEWKNSEARTTSRELFVNSTNLFQKTFPIDNSPRFYYTVIPFLRTIQETQVKPALGSDYDALLAEWISGTIPAEKQTILKLIQESMSLLTMAMAARRLSIQVLPDSVVQNFKTEMQSLKSSKNALEDAIRRFRNDLLEEGLEALDKAKQLRSGDTTEAIYLPKNDACNKYMRT